MILKRKKISSEDVWRENAKAQRQRCVGGTPKVPVWLWPCPVGVVGKGFRDWTTDGLHGPYFYDERNGKSLKGFEQRSDMM